MAKLEEAGLDETTLRDRLRFDAAWIDARRRELEEAAKKRAHWGTVFEERRTQVTRHEERGKPERNSEILRTEAETLKAKLLAMEEALNEDRVRRRMDEENRHKREAEQPRLKEREHQWELWQSMNALIGSAEGDKFRKFAQSLTLDALVDAAGAHLMVLEPRYRLQRVPGQDLEIQVVDQYMGDEVRGVNSLSGGESFLVSLSLALGLSSLSVNRTSIDSLFIDEGFGTLDTNTLDTALATLDTLQATGRCIVVISHIQAIAERVGVRVELAPSTGGGSKIQIHDG